MARVLLADASPTVQRIVELTFAHEPIEVTAVRDGEQALARIAADVPDVVIADHALPGRTGYEVCAFVKGRPELRHVRVLLLSGAFEPVDRIKAAAVGSDGVLVKPFDPAEMIEKVRELLARDGPSPGVAADSATLPAIDETAGRTSDDAEGAGAGDRAEGTRRGAAPLRVLDGPPPRREGIFEDERAVPTLDAVLARLEARQKQPAAAREDAPEPPPAPAPQVPSRLSDLGELADALNALTARHRPPWSPPAEVHEPDPVPGASAAAFADFDPDDAGSAAVRSPLESDGLAPVAFPAAPVEPAAAVAEPPAPVPSAEAAAGMMAPQPSQVSEALVEEVTRRVLERLTPAGMRDAVSRLVAEAAERLLREELERVRRGADRVRSTMSTDG